VTPSLRRLLAGKYARDVRTFPAAARAAWKREGGRGVWRELRWRTLDRIYERGRLLIVEQDLAAAPDVPIPPEISIELLRTSDLPALAGITSGPTLERLRRAAEGGRVGLLAWREGRPVGWAWISGLAEPDLEIYPLPLPAGTAYLWDLHVVPEERSRGIGSALAAARVRQARERGFRYGWRAIDVGYPASLSTLAKTSGPEVRAVGEIQSVKLLRRVRCRFRPPPPGAGSALAMALARLRAP
jgi:GNAT superfamily N-acetyltransferase